MSVHSSFTAPPPFFSHEETHFCCVENCARCVLLKYIAVLELLISFQQSKNLELGVREFRTKQSLNHLHLILSLSLKSYTLSCTLRIDRIFLDLYYFVGYCSRRVIRLCRSLSQFTFPSTYSVICC